MTLNLLKSKKKDNTLVFKNLLNKAKLDKEQYNIVKKSSNIHGKGIDATFEATYGVPTFDKTINFTNQDGKPILVIPLIDTNNEISNILIGFKNENIETFRVLNKDIGFGEKIILNSNKVDCSESGLNKETVGGIFKTTKDLIQYTEQENITSKVIVINLDNFSDGCWGIDLYCDCEEGEIGVYPVDCDNISTGGGGIPTGDGYPNGDGGNPPGTGTGSGGGGSSSDGSGSTNDNDCGDNPFEDIEEVEEPIDDCFF